MNDDNFPQQFSFNETDLDRVYIGQWDSQQLDDYGQIKNGTVGIASVVRSRVDKSREMIAFIGYIPTRHGVSKIPMDGSSGLIGKISERAIDNEGTTNRIDTFLIKHLTGREILEQRELNQKTAEGYTVIKTTGEIDDIVFNMNDEYTFPVYYFLQGRHPQLYGIFFEIPLFKFNHYVKMRDLWYRDYRGSKAYHPNEE